MYSCLASGTSSPKPFERLLWSFLGLSVLIGSNKSAEPVLTLQLSSEDEYILTDP